MAFKYVLGLYLISVVSAALVPATQVYHAGAAAPVAYTAEHVLTKSHEEYDPHPQYKYSYDVQDALSGDSKSQFEERDGDVVHGEYSLVDSDGYKRTVQYTADPIHGFQAEVHREPLAHYAQPTVVKTVAPVAHYAQPTVVKTVAPVAHYAQPTVLKTVSPVTHYSAPTYVKTVQPVAHYSAPTVVKHVAPVTHYTSPAYVKTVAHQPVNTSYSAPASYVTHH